MTARSRSAAGGRAALGGMGALALLAACAPGAGGAGGLAAAPRDPAILIGLDAAGLEAMLGAPELKRREPPAEMWQYRTETCVLDLYLYPGAGDGTPSVAQYAARARTADPAGGPVDAARCLGAVAAGPTAGAS